MRGPDGNGVSTVLLLGGAGYIGSALLPKLYAQGHRVRVLDLFVYGTDAIKPFADLPGVTLIFGDLRDESLVRSAMQGVDAVVHLGGIVGDPACELDRDLTVSVNRDTTRPIALAAKESGVRRFLFASTCALYKGGDVPQSEDSPVCATTLYASTKLEAEQALRELSGPEFRPAALRFATLYGLSGRKRFDLAVNRLTAEAKVEGKITIHGGQQVRPFIHVEDAAEAILALLRAPLPPAGDPVFSIGCDEQNFTIRQIAEMVRAQVPRAEIIVKPLASEPVSYRVQFQKFQAQTGFRPAWLVERGIRQVLEALAGNDVPDYRDARHSNVGHLQQSRQRNPGAWFGSFALRSAGVPVGKTGGNADLPLASGQLR